MDEIQVDARVYKESYYNFKLKTEDGNLLIYNTKNGSLVFESNETEAEVILNILENPNEYIGNPMLQELIKLNCIVEQNKDELMDIKRWHENYSRLKNHINLTLLPAEACNFACPYCFIYKQRPLFMDQWIYDAIYQFLERSIAENTDGTVLDLSWFGGEPLLAIDQICSFMKRIKKLEQENVFRVNASMVTNGYYLTPEIMEKLCEHGVATIQVTLDGDKESHDQTRFLKKNGEATFDIIYNNLKDIKKRLSSDKKFDISIRANFLRSTLDSMDRLLAKFVKDFGDDERFSIYFRPVYNFETTRDDIDAMSPDICSLSEGIKIQTELAYKTMQERKADFEMIRIFDPLPRPTFTWCNAIRVNSFIIGADGALFACDSLITEKELSVGEITVDGKIVLNDNGKKWKISVFDEDNIAECLQCKRFPICTAGCRRSRMTNQQNGCFWSEEDIYDAMRKYIEVNIVTA